MTGPAEEFLNSHTEPAMYLDVDDPAPLEHRTMLVLLFLLDSSDATRHELLLRHLRIERSTVVPDTLHRMELAGFVANAAASDDVYVNSNPLWQLTDAGRERAAVMRAAAEQYARERYGEPAEPALVQVHYRPTAKHIAFYYRDKTTDSGSQFYATWTVGARFVRFFSPEGTVKDVRSVPHTVEPTEETMTGLAAQFGELAQVLHSERAYPSETDGE